MPSRAARIPQQEASILQREMHGSVAILTLNRPEARNCLSEEMISLLHGALKEIEADRSVRTVVIAANGSAFSSGHDLKQMTAHRLDRDRGRAYFEKILNACSGMMQAIVHLPQPVIAAVQGIATAAGCQLVASCDLAVASEAASFATPGVHLGLFCSTPMVALSRNLSHKHSLDMLLTGDPVSAHRAQEIGLVNRVVAAGTEREVAIALAQKIALKSSHTLKIGKTAFYRQAEMGLAEAYDYAVGVMTENMLARDAEEGIGAFLEKREPTWQDK
jgi:enoyl-CoA hydratase/carnithine racemase